MSRLYITGNAVDQNQIPVVGAQVYVFAGGVLAELQDAAGAGLPNPVTTIADGFFEAYSTSPDAHVLEYRWGGKVRYREALSDTERAQAAAQAALAAAGAPSFPSTAAGLAAVEFGQTFYVVTAGVGIIYRKDAGPVATEISRFIVNPQAATAAGLTGFQQSGTGATARTVQAKLRETVSVRDFGAVGDGVANDTAAIQAAIDSLGIAGGEVLIPNEMKCRVLGNLRVQENVSLVGSATWTGRSTTGPGTDTPFENMGSCIRLASTATIFLDGGASLNGLLIYRDGMTFPEPNSNAFAGTAITASGDDTVVSRCFVMGFNKAYLCDGHVRPRVEFLYFDCINGIEITDCGDVPYVTNCHGWPWATIAALGVHTTIERTGKAYYLHDFVDWAKVTDCFCYGYAVGFQATNCNSTTFLNCSADNTFEDPNVTLHTVAYGFVIDGTAGETRLIGCQAAAHGQAAVLINTIANIQTSVIGSNFWSLGNHGILIQGGNVDLTANKIRNTPSGVTVSSTTSRVIDGGAHIFEDCTTPWSINANTTLVRISADNDHPDLSNVSPVGGSGALTLPTIASADPINLPPQGETFNVTGTTNTGSLNGGYAGRRVTLIFSGVLTLFSSTGAANSMRIRDGLGYTTQAGSTITFIHNGVQWHEVGRSA